MQDRAENCNQISPSYACAIITLGLIGYKDEYAAFWVKKSFFSVPRTIEFFLGQFEKATTSILVVHIGWDSPRLKKQ